MERELPGLIAIMEEIARGEYSDRIMAFTTPAHPEPVRRLAEAMGLMMVKIEAREQHRDELIAELRSVNAQLQAATVDTVVSMANALYARDPYTAGHGQRVARYALRLARRAGLPAPEIETIRLAGILHDIGKIGFSDRVFSNEDAALTPGMLAEIRQHPDLAMDILGHLDLLGDALDFIRMHHERLDGSGYPRGFAGDAIPRGARIIAIADCFDAMTTDRPYQQGKSIHQACSILRKIAGSHLDADLVESFITEVEAGGLSTESAPAA